MIKMLNEIHAEWEQMKTWVKFGFSIDPEEKKSLVYWDKSGKFYISDFHFDNENISFAKHYIFGTSYRDDGSLKFGTQYTIRYKGHFLKKENDSLTFEGEWSLDGYVPSECKDIDLRCGHAIIIVEQHDEIKLKQE